jgi:putative N6-adenine-specific DNA methylase
MNTPAPREACFAPCPRGLEEVLADELRELGAHDVRITPGGVAFAASWPDVWRVNLASRIASRVLVRVAKGRYRRDDDVYRLAHAQDWPRHFGVDRTIRVDVTGGSGKDRSPLRSLEFATLRIKDGVCDRFRDAFGKRPSVDTREPDVRIAAYLDATECTLYLDTSGEPLFKRGWRTETGEAPLRENLAAGILRLAGWTPGMALLDPMCGSGTFVVEAAQAVLGIAPGTRRRFAFESLSNFDAVAWARMRDAAPVPSAGLELLRASDVSGDAVAMTRANLERAGVPVDAANAIAPKQIDARQVRPHAETGLLVSNPPYGERLDVRGESRRARTAVAPDEALATFFAEFGDTLKQRFAGWTCHLLSADLALQRVLRLAPDRRTVLYNGAIECRLYRIPLVEGTRR